MHTQFYTELEKLNPQQREAVEQTEGAVLLLAGPGSGKTQVITLRIANIINKQADLANNILALTFTEAAAGNMRNRLVNFIGKQAYSATISTFHGFCNDLIRARSELFLFAKDLQQVDDLTRVRILQDVLDGMDLQLLKTFYNPYFYLDNIRKNISNLKKEGIRAADYEKVIADHEAFFEVNQELNKNGKLLRKWQSYANIIAKNKEFVAVYSRYESEMKERGLYDYEDMINFVNDELTRNEELRLDLQEKYQYVLIDEYQDTNGAQNKLLMTLVSYDANPNIFAVGDEDQSIYSFQGANLKNILQFKQHFTEAQIISTKYNYRSRQPILDVAQRIIEKSPERFDQYYPEIQKQLLAAKIKANSEHIYKQPVVLVKNTTDLQEIEFVASKIKQLVLDGTPPAEIAVIYRSHADATALLDKLTVDKIAFRSETANNAFNLPSVKNLLSLIKYLDDLGDSAKLTQILHMPNWKISVLDLYKVLRVYGNSGKNLSLLDLLADSSKLKTFSLVDASAVSAAITTLLELRRIALTEPLPVFFLKLLEVSGLLAQAEESEDLESINAYYSLYNFISGHANTQEDYKLADLVADVASMQTNRISIKTPNLTKYSDSVRLLTAHAAKGLEFEHVFIIKATDKNWGNRREIDKLKLLDLNLSDGNAEAVKEARNAEERRLFFVALTRAKQQLYISYANNYTRLESESTSVTTPSEFISDIPAELIHEVDNTTSEVTAVSQLSLKPVEFNKQIAESYLSGLVAEFRLSYTAFRNFSECPQRFLYANLLRAPRFEEKPLVLGSAVHIGLEKFYRQLADIEKLSQLDASFKSQYASLEDVLNAANNFLRKQPLEGTDYAEVKAETEKILQSYYPQLDQHTQRSVLATEYKFSTQAFLSDIPLSGKADLLEKLDEHGNTVRVVDFKTSKPISRNALQKDDYYKQLVFYKLLADSDPAFKPKVAQVGIEFVRPNSSGYFKSEYFEIPDADSESLKTEITAAMAKIRNLEFDKRCGLPSCQICNLLY